MSPHTATSRPVWKSRIAKPRVCKPSRPHPNSTIFLAATIASMRGSAASSGNSAKGGRGRSTRASTKRSSSRPSHYPPFPGSGDHVDCRFAIGRSTVIRRGRARDRDPAEQRRGRLALIRVKEFGARQGRYRGSEAIPFNEMEPDEMTRMLRFTIVLLGAFAVSAPAFAAENWPDSFDSALAQIRATINTTDMAGYLAAVKKPDGALLIDVREDSEYKAGHIPGTVNIPRGLLEFRIWKQLGYPKAVDLNKKIYVQCATGGRATLATADLKRIGFANAVAVIMNLGDWAQKGYPMEK